MQVRLVLFQFMGGNDDCVGSIPLEQLIRSADVAIAFFYPKSEDFMFIFDAILIDIGELPRR